MDSSSVALNSLPELDGSDAAAVVRRMLSQLHRLGTVDAELLDESDEVEPAPTPRAALEAERLLTESALTLGGQFPEGSVHGIDYGGIRVEWWRERERCVHLVVHSSSDEHGHALGMPGNLLHRRPDSGQLASLLCGLAASSSR
jgi:hypothetical protein